MQVVGPNKRQMSSALAQLRHLFMLMSKADVVTPNMRGILSREIRRLESLDRALFEPPQPDPAVGQDAEKGQG